MLLSTVMFYETSYNNCIDIHKTITDNTQIENKHTIQMQKRHLTILYRTITVRPPKKSCFVVLHRPLQLFWNSEKVFTVQKNTYPIFEIPEKGCFFLFQNWKFVLNISKQFSTLPQLMKWSISKIAPWNLIRHHLNGYNVV